MHSFLSFSLPFRCGYHRLAMKKEKDPGPWAKTLQHWRKKATNFTQEKLAAQASLPSRSVGAIERGERKPTAEEIVLLCMAMKVDVAQFHQVQHDLELKDLLAVQARIRQEKGAPAAKQQEPAQLDEFSQAMDTVYAYVKKVILEEVRKVKEAEKSQELQS